jgi:hypothetical protein
MNQSVHEITQIIPLSSLSVSRRIDEMANDVEKQLVAQLRVQKFAPQIYESSLRDNKALLMAYVRFLNDEQLNEEMLFARKLKTDTKVRQYLKKLRDISKKTITVFSAASSILRGSASKSESRNHSNLKFYYCVRVVGFDSHRLRFQIKKR